VLALVMGRVFSGRGPARLPARKSGGCGRRIFNGRRGLVIVGLVGPVTNSGPI